MAVMFCLSACKTQSKTTTAQQTTVELIDNHWKLTELNGVAVEVKKGEGKEPYLVLHGEGNRVNGNGGCNGFMGSYSIAGDKISFSQMAMTMMACPSLDKENEFMRVLEKVEKYTISGTVFTLFDAESNPLAKFEVVFSN